MELLKVLALIVLMTAVGINAHGGTNRDQGHDKLRNMVVEKCAVDQTHPICKLFGWVLDEQPVTNTQDKNENKGVQGTIGNWHW